MNQPPEPLDETKLYVDRLSQGSGDMECRHDPELDDPFEVTEREESSAGVWSATSMESTGNAPWLGEEGPHGEDFNLAFLQYSARPGSLGKIGNYEVLGVLGRGGMGIVLKAFDPPLHRTVAIKVMDPKLAVSRRSRKRFLREARSAAAINHANVVTIHAVGIQGGMPYLVMEFIPGISLRQRIRNGPMEIPEIERISLQVAHGLTAAHEQGVIHRDIKPANIMLEESVDRVKITDFGLAVAAMNMSEMTSVDHVVGTPAYMSPEQVLTAPIDPRSDLFSLGCVIYAMATGNSPFKGTHTLEVIRKVTDLPHMPLRALRPDASSALCTLVDRLLAKDPNDRFRSAKDVAEVLQKSLLESDFNSKERRAVVIDRHDEQTVATPGRTPGRSWGWDRAWTTVASVALVVVAVGSVGMWVNHPETPPAMIAPQTRTPVAVKPSTVLTVGATAESDFSGLGPALAAARPGMTIKVAPGNYHEVVTIAGTDGAHGITLDARGATLTAPDEAEVALRLDASAGVVVRGLTIRAAHPGQLALSLNGPSAGTLVEDVRIESAPDDRAGQLVRLTNVTGTELKPVVLRGLKVDGGGLGIGDYAMGDTPSSWVKIEGCRFAGPGVHVMLHGRHEKTIIQECVFLGGANGVNLDFYESGSSGNMVVNNTFLDCRFWIGLVHTMPQPGQASLINNAILGSERVEWFTPDGPAAAARAWTFRSNWWEPSDETDANPGLDGAIAEVRPDLGILSLDPRNADFLRPADDSPLARGGAGGDFREYAGAVAPSSHADRSAPGVARLSSHNR